MENKRRSNRFRRTARKVLRSVLPEAQSSCLAGFSDTFSRIALEDELKKWSADIAQKAISGWSIIDIGTGGGWLPIEIARRNPALHIVGIDVSPRMIEIARNNASRNGVDGTTQFFVASGKKATFKDGAFDFAISSGSLHHWKEPIMVLEECFRILKQKREFWLYDLNGSCAKKDILDFRKDKISRLSKTGFARVLINHLPFIGQNRELAIDAYTEEEVAGLIGKTSFSKKYAVERYGVFAKYILTKDGI